MIRDIYKFESKIKDLRTNILKIVDRHDVDFYVGGANWNIFRSIVQERELSKYNQMLFEIVEFLNEKRNR